MDGGPSKKKAELILNCAAMILLFLFFIFFWAGRSGPAEPAACQVCGRFFFDAAGIRSIRKTGCCETCFRQWDVKRAGQRLTGD